MELANMASIAQERLGPHRPDGYRIGRERNIAMKKVLILGVDRIMPKLFYFADEFRKHDVSYLVYTHDQRPEAEKYTAEYGAGILQAPPHKRSAIRLLRNFYRLFSLVRKKDVAHAELYSDYHMLASLGYFIILYLKGIPVVLWCRGELYDWKTFTWWQRLYFHLVVPRARLVVLKETYMRRTLESGGVRTKNNLILLHNAVPIPPYNPKTFGKRKLVLLFLNMFKPWRNVTFCVEIAAELKRSGLDFSMSIVGEKGLRDGSLVLLTEAQRLKAAIAEHNVERYVTVHPFSVTPMPYYQEADIFLLPADLVYCNYALLESMSHGVIPMVNSGDSDYQEIVQDGVSGYALPLKSDLWSSKIIELAENPSMARMVSANARRRIEEEFGSAGTFDKYWTALKAAGING